MTILWTIAICWAWNKETDKEAKRLGQNKSSHTSMSRGEKERENIKQQKTFVESLLGGLMINQKCTTEN